MEWLSWGFLILSSVFVLVAAVAAGTFLGTVSAICWALVYVVRPVLTQYIAIFTRFTELVGRLEAREKEVIEALKAIEDRLTPADQNGRDPGQAGEF